MAKEITLKCTNNAFYEGNLVEKNEEITVSESEAKTLINSTRFEVANKKADIPTTVPELKDALDELGVEYSADDKKADLVELYESAIS